MQEITTKTVRDIALETPSAMPVFENYKIDYCCGGNVSFDEACNKAGVSAGEVWKEIEAALSRGENKVDDLSKWTQAALVDHIIDEHHDYTRDAIDRLAPLMDKVWNKHGPQHPELEEIRSIFTQLADDMLLHMKKEEMMLFPFIKQLERMRSDAPMQPFGSVQNPVRVMMNEHDTAGDMLRRMSELSKEYAIPEGACPSYIGLYTGFEELEKDLHRHIHLENNILFPRAIEMENPVVGEAGESPKAGTCCTAH